MKKVGILTWYFGANYGAIAQSIALYRSISFFGYDVKMINYKPKGYKKTILAANIPRKGKRISNFKSTINGTLKYIQLSNTKRFLKETSRVKNAEDINHLSFDNIILGSDAIFNIRHLLCDPVYYGVGIKTKKATYAPSCEYLSVDTKLPDSYKQSLLEMTSLSVRDKNTFKLINNNIGLEPTIVLDPTFLYDFSHIHANFKYSHYILIYAFSEWSEYSSQIKEYAKRHSLNVISIGLTRKWADKSIENASFEDWISAFKKADLIITDSFHGTVFSLKNKKQFVLCSRNDKAAKIDDLLSQFNINIEKYSGNLIEQYIKENYLNYDEINPVINDRVKQSLTYLKNALEAS